MAVRDEVLQAFEPEHSPVRRWRQIRAGLVDILTNVPLLLGTAMVLALILVALYAPVLAPHNPFEKLLMLREGGKWVGSPPYPPSDRFPLGSDADGRDILSLLLYGARQTLVIAATVVAARLTLGCTIGALAGWYPGSRFDRLAMAAADFSAAFPPLLLGAILVFLFDIRKGMLTFALALCFVGWGEVAQYIRSEFLVVRRQPYIEGARTIGLSEVSVIMRHAVPNVVTSLIVIAALEMSAVLLLLGELGFVGIFVGGGRLFGRDVDMGLDRPTTFFDVPEWGGMLAGSWRYVDSWYWIPLYPAAAFAFAILGFNLFGEGLRRLVEKGRIPVSAIYSRRTLAVIAAIVLSTMAVMNNVGPQAELARLAARFDEQRALAHIEVLASDAMRGRASGSPEDRLAAEYIARQFADLGLLPAGDNGTYFQTFAISYTRLLETPIFEWVDDQGHVLESFVHRQDFREMVSSGLGSGSVENAGVVFVLGGISYHEGDKIAGISPSRDDFRGVDVRGKVVLLVPDSTFLLSRPVQEIRERGGLGVLIPASIGAQMGMKGSYIVDRPGEPTIPGLVIRRDLADRILASHGVTIREIVRRSEELRAQGKTPSLAFDTGVRVRMRVSLLPWETRTTQNVLGYLPGSDPNYAWQTVIIGGHYDHIAPDPNGRIFAGAHDNASGVAVTLEVARLLQETGFRPKQTVLFAAWGAEELGLLGSKYYVTHPAFPPKNTIAVLNLDSVGRGNRRQLAISKSEKAYSLYYLVENAAHRMGVGTIPESYGGSDQDSFLSYSVPAVLLLEPGEIKAIHTTEDTIAAIEPHILDEVGMTAAFALMDLTDGR